jgi:hypothetical protein
MMKIYVNRTPRSGPWGGGNAWVKAAHEFIPMHGHELIHANQTQSSKPDVILLAGLDSEDLDHSAETLIRYKLNDRDKQCKVIIRVNENDARKGTDFIDRRLVELSEHVDGTVFVSRWLQEYFLERGWRCLNNTVVINGVHSRTFCELPKICNGKVNIVTHHWSDNRMKGADVYEQLDEFVGKHDKEFTFTFIGRHKCNFKHTLTIPPMDAVGLGNILGQFDVYVSASRNDPGPNHCTESLSCGLPTYVHVEGGGCVEFAGDDHVYHDWNELESLLLKKQYVRNDSLQLSSWSQCIDEYVKFIEHTARHNVQCG